MVEAEHHRPAGGESFLHWLDTRGTVPTIRALREHANHLRRRAGVERAVRLLAKGEDPAKVIEALSPRLLTSKYPPPLASSAGRQRGAPGDCAALCSACSISTRTA